MYDPRAAGQLCADRALWRPAGLHALQRGDAPGRARSRWAALRLPAAEASLQRQIHARGWPLHPDVLCAVDDHGPGAERRFEATGDRRYYADPQVAILPVDALGFSRGAGAMRRCSRITGLPTIRSSRRRRCAAFAALAGHAESTDVTNDVNGGPSGIGIATAAGKAAFWDVMGAGIDAPKIMAFEGEFAMTEGHAQELKTQALALQVGKRLRVMLSDNNAGIDDSLIGGVIDRKYEGYRLIDQWTSYGWNVFVVQDGNDYDQVVDRAQDHGGLGSGGSPADGRDRQDDEGLLAGGRRSQDSRLRRSDRRLSQPSVCDEDELGLLPRVGEDIREALRRGVPGDSRRRREGSARATDPVQDQHRRRDVAARPQRHRRLARGSARGERRVAAR